MKRRQFIQITAAGAVGVAVAGPASARAGHRYAEGLARPDLLRLLGAERTAEIGSAYCATTPHETTINALATAIESGSSTERAGPEGALPVAVRIRDDFERGRTVQVNGWILAVTEARQCALFSLLTA